MEIRLLNQNGKLILNETKLGLFGTGVMEVALISEYDFCVDQLKPSQTLN